MDKESMTQEQKAIILRLITLLVLVQARLMPFVMEKPEETPDSVKDLMTAAMEVIQNLRAFLPEGSMAAGPEESIRLLKFLDTLYTDPVTLQ